MDIGTGLASFGNDIATAMGQYHEEHQAYDQSLGVANALSRIGIDENGNLVPVVDQEGKKISDVNPVVNPKALEAFQAKNRAGWERSRGALEALSRLGVAQIGRIQSQQAQLQALPQELDIKRQAAEKALAGPTGEEERARTEQIKATTAATRAKAEAAANAPTVMMDIGGGNMIRVPGEELVKHPEFLKTATTAKNVSEQVFAATGLLLPQIQQGWNKRIVNNQLQFEVPVAQTKQDPMTGRVFSVLDAKGKALYEQVDNPDFNPDKPVSEKNPKTITKVNKFNVPEQYTPDVLKIIGTSDVQGAGRIKLPATRETATTIVPGSVQGGMSGVQPGYVPIRDPQGNVMQIPRQNLSRLPQGYTVIGQ